MTIKISGKVLAIALAVLAAVLAVAAISYVTATVTGDMGYISCFRKANETELDAYEKYVNATPSTASEFARHAADFTLFERQYIKDARAC